MILRLEVYNLSWTLKNMVSINKVPTIPFKIKYNLVFLRGNWVKY